MLCSWRGYFLSLQTVVQNSINLAQHSHQMGQFVHQSSFRPLHLGRHSVLFFGPIELLLFLLDCHRFLDGADVVLVLEFVAARFLAWDLLPNARDVVLTPADQRILGPSFRHKIAAGATPFEAANRGRMLDVDEGEGVGIWM